MLNWLRRFYYLHLGPRPRVCYSVRFDSSSPPEKWARIHYGQFGHKCLHLYCNECRDLRYADAPENATEEEKLLREIFKEKPEDIIWEPYEESE